MTATRGPAPDTGAGPRLCRQGSGAAGHRAHTTTRDLTHAAHAAHAAAIPAYRHTGIWTPII